MKYLLSAMAVVLLFAMAGCATDRYPLSGEKCKPGDAMEGMSAPDCPQVTAG